MWAGKHWHLKDKVSAEDTKVEYSECPQHFDVFCIELTEPYRYVTCERHIAARYKCAVAAGLEVDHTRHQVYVKNVWQKVEDQLVNKFRLFLDCEIAFVIKLRVRK